MGIANSNMAFGYRLTPDLASQIQSSQIQASQIQASQIHAGQIHAGQIHASQIHAGQRLETATTAAPVLLLPGTAWLRRGRRLRVAEHN